MLCLPLRAGGRAGWPGVFFTSALPAGAVVAAAEARAPANRRIGGSAVRCGAARMQLQVGTGGGPAPC